MVPMVVVGEGERKRSIDVWLGAQWAVHTIPPPLTLMQLGWWWRASKEDGFAIILSKFKQINNLLISMNLYYFRM